MKVSAIVCNRDELWLEQSLISINGLVDEIVVVDASREIPDKKHLQNLVDQSEFQFVHTRPCIYKQLDQGYLMARYPLLLRWDSDFIAMEGFDGFSRLLHNLTGKVAVYAYVKNVTKDMKENLHREVIAVTMSPRIMNRNRFPRKIYGLYRMVVGGKPPRFSHVPLPWTYWHHKYSKCVIEHRNIKPEWRDRERTWQVDWQLCSETEKNEWGSFEQYVKKQIEIQAEGDTYKFAEGRLPY